MRTAIFPGSFDPFTVGHYDVLESALQLFDKIIVAVGYNSSKKGFLPPETRVEIIQQAVAHLPNVEVCTYSGLTIDLCHNLGVNHIIRGLRTTTDFEMESVIAQANKKMAIIAAIVVIRQGLRQYPIQELRNATIPHTNAAIETPLPF